MVTSGDSASSPRVLAATSRLPGTEEVPSTETDSLPFAGLEVRFTVADGRLTVRNVTPGESRQASGSAQTGQTDAEKRKDML